MSYWSDENFQCNVELGLRYKILGYFLLFFAITVGIPVVLIIEQEEKNKKIKTTRLKKSPVTVTKCKDC